MIGVIANARPALKIIVYGVDLANRGLYLDEG
jgi:hypothetical protein